MLKFIRKSLLNLSRPIKRIVLVGFDFSVLSFAVWIAYSIRLGELLIPDLIQWAVILLAPITAIPVFIRFGLYRSVIRYLPERALWTIINATIIATLLWVGALFILEITRLSIIPRSVPLIYSVLAIFLIAGSRFGVKYFLWTPTKKQYSGQVVIYGAGSAGSQLSAALHQEGSKYVAGFIDDDKFLQGQEVAGVRVFAPEKLDYLIDNMGVKEVIISIPTMDSSKRQSIVSNLSRYNIKIRSLPALADLASGRYLISQVREIDIDDVLGRSPVPADPELLQKMIENRSILVSGAGGSIGSELCRLIVKWKPRKLVLLEANEFSLYQIERILKKRVNLPVVPVLGSVSDKALIERTIKQEGTQVIFHAAAHKHVPLVEANILEGIRNNIFGTKTIAQAALELGVENFVLISTDKAVRPTNVMGATKRWAELIIRECAKGAKIKGDNQKFCAVRFGNVLGSNGSVVPLFKEQIASGGPVSVTDKKMTRYFMSIHEAAELIVQAGAMSKGGDIFLLDMGEPVKIYELAENMIRLAGCSIRDEKNPNGDIEISIIGKRAGEKIYEELFYDLKSVKKTRQSKILRSLTKKQSAKDIEYELKNLRQEYEAENESSARKILFDLVSAEGLPTSKNTKIIPININQK